MKEKNRNNNDNLIDDKKLSRNEMLPEVDVNNDGEELLEETLEPYWPRSGARASS